VETWNNRIFVTLSGYYRLGNEEQEEIAIRVFMVGRKMAVQKYI
jgi:hypothetical protein